MLAFFTSLSGQELFLLFLIGLLLYGRNLPEAGRNLGRVVAQLKRSFNDFKDQLDKEGDIREVKKVIQDTAREVKNVSRVPTAMHNPAGALRELTHQAMSEPLPDDDPADAPVAADAPADPSTNGHATADATQPKP
ncbi:MAG: twin-arginine translocase TatA/TatE family subunit [Planctomycetota bacterium]